MKTVNNFKSLHFRAGEVAQPLKARLATRNIKVYISVGETSKSVVSVPTANGVLACIRML